MCVNIIIYHAKSVISSACFLVLTMHKSQSINITVLKKNFLVEKEGTIFIIKKSHIHPTTVCYCCDTFLIWFILVSYTELQEKDTSIK